MTVIVNERKTNCMEKNHGNIDFDNCATLTVNKYPLHTEYVLAWSDTDNITVYWVTISTRYDTFIVTWRNFPDLTIDDELCQDPHNMTAEDWTLLTMLHPQITTQYWNILKLLKDYVDKLIEEEYLINNVKCILKGETN